MNDTICAISTAQGLGAIAIVRVSGEEAIEIVKTFKGQEAADKLAKGIVYSN